MAGYLGIEVTAGSVKALPVAVTTVGAKVVSGGCWYYGASFLETTGAATASVTVTSGGVTVDVFAIASGGVSHHWLGPMGIRVESDITVTVTSGSIQGAVFAGYETP